MKICCPTMGNKGLDEKVYNHFGSADFFTIYDSEKDSAEVVENDNPHHAHGACQPLDIISEYKVDIIFTSGMGRRAVEMLNTGGIKVYRLEGDTVKQAVEKFKNNELQELTAGQACQGHGCH